MTSIIVSVGSIAVVVAAAVKGVAYRGAYFGMALAALVAAFAVSALIPSGLQIAAAQTDAERAGSQFLFDNGPGIAVWFFALTLAGLIGGIVFRQRRA